MDRQIKFRAWNPESKKFYEPIIYLEEWYRTGRDFEDGTPSADPIMQFTGLQDKNGKDIYEDDVVRILYTDWASKSSNDPRTLEQYLKDIAYVGKIVFENGAFKVAIPSKMYPGEWHTTSIHPGTHGYIEVVGNQYESPELINK